MKNCLVVTSACWLAACSASTEDGAAHQVALHPASLEEGAQHTTAETVATTRGSFTFVKRVDSDGRVIATATDSQGNVVSEDAAKAPAPEPIGHDLAELIRQNPQSDQLVNVVIALRADLPAESLGETLVARSLKNASVEDVLLNDQRATFSDVARANDRRDAVVRERQQRLSAQRRANTLELSQRESWALEPTAVTEAAEGLGVLVREIRVNDVSRLIARNSDLVVGVDVVSSVAPKDMWNALAVTSVRAPNGIVTDPNARGEGIGIFVSECGCPAEPNYTNRFTYIGGPTDDAHARQMISTIRQVSPDSWIYCNAGSGGVGVGATCVNGVAVQLPTGTQLAGLNGNPPVRIISSAWGGRSTDYNLKDWAYDAYSYNQLVTMVAAAGNEGADCLAAPCPDGLPVPVAPRFVCSPGKGLNVVTAGGYNDSTMNSYLSSSYKDPLNTKNAKPEVSAPAVSLAAGVDPMGLPYTLSDGTSFATSIISGIVADLMEGMNWIVASPHLVKAILMTGAIDGITSLWPGVSAFDINGIGGVDALAARWNHWDFAWDGSNSWFNTVESGDIQPGNDAIDLDFNLTQGQYAAFAIAWLNDGNFTYAHRTDPHPIGQDYDLVVTGPGGFSTSSLSWDNPFEFVSFWVQSSGVYRVRISRPFNRDTNARTNLALVHKW